MKTLKQIKNERIQNIPIVIELILICSILWNILDMIYCQNSMLEEDLNADVENVYKLQFTHLDSQSEYFDKNDSLRIGPALLELKKVLLENPNVHSACLSIASVPFAHCVKMISFNLDTTSYACCYREVQSDFIKVFKIKDKYNKLSEDSLIDILENKQYIYCTMNKYVDLDSLINIGDTLYTAGSPETKLAIKAKINRIKQMPHYPSCCDAIYAIMNDDAIYWFDLSGLGEFSLRLNPNGNINELKKYIAENRLTKLKFGNVVISQISELKEECEREMSNYKRNQLATTIIRNFLLFNVFLVVFSTFWLRTQKRKESIEMLCILGSSKLNIIFDTIKESLALFIFSFLCSIIINFLLAYNELNFEFYGQYLQMERFFKTNFYTFALVLICVILGVIFPAYKASKIIK